MKDMQISMTWPQRRVCEDFSKTYCRWAEMQDLKGDILWGNNTQFHTTCFTEFNMLQNFGFT